MCLCNISSFKYVIQASGSAGYYSKEVMRNIFICVQSLLLDQLNSAFIRLTLKVMKLFIKCLGFVFIYLNFSVVDKLSEW